MPKQPPYVAWQVAHDEGIAREARLTMQAMALAREMETGPPPPARHDHRKAVR